MNISELIDFSFLLQSAWKDRQKQQILTYAAQTWMLQSAWKDRQKQQITGADGVPLVREIEIPKRAE